MPLDGQTENFAPTETKPDVFSLEGLIAWLVTLDPETEYDFLDTFDCLLCRFAKAHRYKNPSAGSSYIRRNANDDDDVCVEIDPSGGDIAGRLPWTYGAALTRARALLAEGE